MNYMSAKDAAEKWGVSLQVVELLCSEKRIPGAMMVGNMWVLPGNATMPINRRKDRYGSWVSENRRPRR